MKESKNLTLSNVDFDQQITLRDAYLLMFKFIEEHWSEAMQYEVSDVLSELSLWQTEGGDKAPMDASVLTDFIQVHLKLKHSLKNESDYTGADIKLT